MTRDENKAEWVEGFQEKVAFKLGWEGRERLK